jgi:hypothetical protein
LHLIVLFVVVLAWLQIVAAIGRVGEGFFNGLLHPQATPEFGRALL